MINSIDYYFEVSKEAKMANDDEGNDSECYLKLGFALKNPMEDSEAADMRIKMADNALIGASNVLKVDKSLLKIISEDEYNEKTENDFEDEDDDFDDYYGED
jgi:hypothetical protein